MNKKILILLTAIILVLIVVGGVVIFNKISKKEPGSQGSERKLVALGASFTKANNLSASLIGDHSEYSFATGEKIASLFLYLKDKEKNLTAENLAESGANSQSVLQKQVPNAISLHPKYVTIDIMADIFEDDTPQQLKENLREIITQIKENDTVILLGSYPNFSKIRSASFAACKEDKLQLGIGKLTDQKIQSFNAAIKEVAQEKGSIFVDIYDVLGPEDVSDYDCIHPNIEGQKKLAQSWIKALEDIQMTENDSGQADQAQSPATDVQQQQKTEDIPTSTGPIDILSDSIINQWGANCKNKGSDINIANCILDWQENNIFWCYINPEAQSYFDYFSPDYPDCVVDMQFQQMVPNSFPVSKVMQLKVRNSKIFGACYTYATIYCAIARWNGLTCRAMEAKTTISFYSSSSGDYAAGYCGSAPKTFLDKLGYSCAEWRQKNWSMDADHYWAEVLINGQWQIMERSTWAYKHDTNKYIIEAGRSYGDTGW